MAAEYIPLYYESSWAILSTIGIINMLYGLMVIGITGYSPIALVPLVCSVATAIANGLCFYALYQSHGTMALLIGGVFADFFWLIQEAGLSFYSYMILNRVLRNRPRIIFQVLFWILMVAITTIRMAIIACRAKNTLDGNQNQALQDLVAHLHIGYFTSLALVEIVSAFFLLKIFYRAKRASAEISSHGGLFQYLLQSTELRISVLAVIGFTRAVTYSFQKKTKADGLTGQLDRFVFTLECMFPTMMYIDILASRIARVTSSYPSSSQNHTSNRNVFQRSRAERDIKMFSIIHNRPKSINVSSSQERIVNDEEEAVVKSSAGSPHDAEKASETSKADTLVTGPGISKTVEFSLHAS